MELQHALSIFDEIAESLYPLCEIVNLAGSCRRSRPMMKDMDIVCLPKTKIIRDVFGEELKRIRTKEFVGVVESLGERIKGSTIDGKYNKIKLKQGIMLDLFLPPSFDYYRIFAIRTGPDDYAKKVLAGGWRKKGWCGSDAGLRKTRDCRETKTSKGASTWKCVNPEAELPPVWNSEKDFFDWINVKWVEPSLRNL